MGNSLRKHVLSNYASVNSTGIITNVTIDTATTEISDPDEFYINSKGATIITENIENSDADEIMMMGLTQITNSAKVSYQDTLCFGEPTGLTHAIEDSDPDEFRVSGRTTYETNTIEISDPDEFRLEGITLETRGTETSDPDEMQMGPTKHTFTVENSDEDEFLLM